MTFSWDNQIEEKDYCATEGCMRPCLQDDDYCWECRNEMKREANDD